MTDDYYQSIITQKSWDLLTDLRKRYDFILIGGWAVFLYTRALKSKDIDIIVSFETLAKLQQEFPLVKNERLKKYEIKREEVDIDIYLPYYSDPGLPIEEISKYALEREGFRLPTVEVLLILKQNVYLRRKFSAKGQKDRLDILALATSREVNFDRYREILHQNNRVELINHLKDLLSATVQEAELNLNPHRFARQKKRILAALSESEGV